MQTLLSAQSPAFLISATTTATAAVALPAKESTVRVVNEGPNNAYICIAAAPTAATVPTATAAATCTPVLAGSDVAFSIPVDQVYYISAITKVGTATLDVQIGEGV